MFEQFERIGRTRLLPKGSLLIEQGQLNDRLFLVRSGLVKAYYETWDGRQFIKSFISEGGFIASVQSIAAGRVSAFSVLALEDCEVLEIVKAALLQHMTDHPEAMQCLNTLLITLAQKKEQREYELLCLSPEQRYLRFCERETNLVGRLSQEDIARYLGITAVSLSRIRRRRAQRL